MSERALDLVQGEPILIPRDTRRRNAALLAFGCVLAGAILSRAVEDGLVWATVTLAAAETTGVLSHGSRGIEVPDMDNYLIGPLSVPPAPAEFADVEPLDRACDYGLLSVTCYPGCDDVTLDGRSLGPSPVRRVRVTRAFHMLGMRRGSTTQWSEIPTDNGQLMTIQQVME